MQDMVEVAAKRKSACSSGQGHRNSDAAPSRPRVATRDGHELRAAPRVRALCLSLPLYLYALWASPRVMSSLMNWDGSQDAQKRREAEEARAKAPEENPTASDLTHGSTSGQSLTANGDAALRHGSPVSTNICLGLEIRVLRACWIL